MGLASGIEPEIDCGGGVGADFRTCGSGSVSTFQCPGEVRYEPGTKRCRCSTTGRFIKCPDHFGPCAKKNRVRIGRSSKVCRCKKGGHLTLCDGPKKNDNDNKGPRRLKLLRVIEKLFIVTEIAKCAAEYNECLIEAGRDYAKLTDMCGSWRDHADRAECYRNADRDYHLAVAECATQFAICSANKMLPIPSPAPSPGKPEKAAEIAKVN